MENHEFKITKYDSCKFIYLNERRFVLQFKVYSDFFIMKHRVSDSPETLAKALNLKLRHLVKVLKLYNNEFETNANFYKVWFKTEEDLNKFCEKYLDHIVMANKFLN